MADTKAVRDAKARVAEIEAKRAELQAGILEAEAVRKPFVAKVAAVRKRRARTPIISNTSGSIWFGTLASISLESYGLRAATKDAIKPKEISEAIASGGLKLNGGRYGVSITLRGLAGRVRIPDKARVAAHKKAVAARVRADARARAALAAEQDALRACFETATKVPTEAILPDLVAEAVAIAKLEKVPEPHDLRHEMERLSAWEGSPLNLAIQHLKFAQSGSTEPCPCANCARDRQEAIRRRNEEARIAQLPMKLVECPTHGRKRMHVERRRHYIERELVATKTGYVVKQGWHEDMPFAHCPKGDTLIDTVQMAADDAKAAAAEAKKKARAPRLSWVCPNPECGEEAPFEPDEGEVTCATCEVVYDAGAVKTFKPEKAAA